MKIRTLKYLAVIELDKYDAAHVMEVAKHDKEATVLKDEEGNELFRINFVNGECYNKAEELRLGVNISTRKDGTDISIAFPKAATKTEAAKVIAPILPNLNKVLEQFGKAMTVYDAAVNATLAMFVDNEEIVTEEVPDTVNEEA